MWKLIKKTFSEWSADNVPRLGAALSYYTVFSLAPLLIIATAIAGFFLGEEAVSGQVSKTLSGLIGPVGAKAIEQIIANTSRSDSGWIATTLGIIILLFGASGVFLELQSSLNIIWEVKPKPNRNFWSIVHERFLSFTMVLGTGFLLLVSLLVSAALASISKFMGDILPGGMLIWEVINDVISYLVITGLFAMLFKYVPDTEIAWRDVWIGAAVTSFLFIVGKFLIGLYLGRASIGSTYGAAGSLAVVLLWVYYVSQVFFLGAEFTQVYSNTYGSNVKTNKESEPQQKDVEKPEIPRAA